MEILAKEKYSEYEDFYSKCANSTFTQASAWVKVKDNWNSEIVVSRDENNKIVGSLLILIRNKPNLLYAPRAGGTFIKDEKIFTDLLLGVKAIAKREKSYMFTMDPFIYEDDTQFATLCQKYGLKHNKRSLIEFECYQPRVNYLINIKDKTMDEIFANFHKKWRYNVRVAIKHNVECKDCGLEGLDDFYRLMTVTTQRDGFICRPKSYFEKMIKSFNGEIKLYLCYYEGKAISGAITSYYGDHCTYIYGASDNECRNVMPNYLMQYTMINEAVNRGCGIYDFMGISGYKDENSKTYGLYKFKHGFGGEIAPFIGEFEYIFSPIKKKFFDFMITIRKHILRVLLLKKQNNDKA